MGNETTKNNSSLNSIFKRESGQISTLKFSRSFAASQDLVLRLGIDRNLEKHRGCVNTVNFNADGDTLLSGSDDRMVVLWEWETGRIKSSFHSGHFDNILEAKFMPFTNDHRIVTCGADGQVRLAEVLEGGRVETTLLASHEGRVHDLAVEPGSPHIFYSCGEDGLVHRFDLRCMSATELLTCVSIVNTKIYMRIVGLNAIAIDPRNPNLFAVGGTDVYAQLYDIRKYRWDGPAAFDCVDYFCPPHLIGTEVIGITGLSFSTQSELLVSYNDESIYLFTRQMGCSANPISSSSASAENDSSEAGSGSISSHSTMETDEKVASRVYEGHTNSATVKGVGFFGPSSEYVVSGSDCGRIFIWKKNDGQLIRVMEADNYVVNCIEPHPHSTVLASSGLEKDIKIWTPKAIDRACLPTNIVKKRPRIPWRAIRIDDDEDSRWSSYESNGDDNYYDDSEDDSYGVTDGDGDDDYLVDMDDGDSEDDKSRDDDSEDDGNMHDEEKDKDDKNDDDDGLGDDKGT